MSDEALLLAIALTAGNASVKKIRFSINTEDGCLYVNYPNEWNVDDNSENNE